VEAPSAYVVDDHKDVRLTQDCLGVRLTVSTTTDFIFVSQVFGTGCNHVTDAHQVEASHAARAAHFAFLTVPIVIFIAASRSTDLRNGHDLPVLVTVTVQRRRLFLLFS
jgi:hypothetical protein